MFRVSFSSRTKQTIRFNRQSIPDGFNFHSHKPSHGPFSPEIRHVRAVLGQSSQFWRGWTFRRGSGQAVQRTGTNHRNTCCHRSNSSTALMVFAASSCFHQDARLDAGRVLHQHILDRDPRASSSQRPEDCCCRHIAPSPTTPGCSNDNPRLICDVSPPSARLSAVTSDIQQTRSRRRSARRRSSSSATGHSTPSAQCRQGR